MISNITEDQFSSTPKRCLIAMPTRANNPRHDAFWCALCAANACPGENDCDKIVMLNSNALSITANRNQMIEDFLTKTKHENLLMVDDDVSIPNNAVTKLLECEADVAMGCVPFVDCFHKAPRVVIATITENIPFWDMEWFSGIRKLYAAGGACMMLSRKLLERMQAPWFQHPELEKNGLYGTEDTLFFSRMREMGGVKMVAHGDVRCTHQVSVDLANFLGAGGRWWGVRADAVKETQPPELSYIPILCDILDNTERDIRSMFLMIDQPDIADMILKNKSRFPKVEKAIQQSVPSSPKDWYYPTTSMNGLKASAHGDYDLLLIDGGSPEYRVSVAKHALDTTEAIVMVHDADHPLIYRTFFNHNAKHRTMLRPGWGPETLIMTNGAPFRLNSKEDRTYTEYGIVT